MTLSDTHLVLLSAAAQRDDLLLTPPAHLKPPPLRAMSQKLLRLALVEERPVLLDQPAWRVEEGERFGLRLAPAGLRVLGLDIDAVDSDQGNKAASSGGGLPAARRD